MHWIVVLSLLSHTAVWAVDPGCAIKLGPWLDGAPCPNFHIEGASIVVSNKLYVVGGFGGKQAIQVMTNLLDIYDPMNDLWRSGSPLPQRVSHINGATDGQNAWFAGGFIPTEPGKKDKPSDQVWQYSTITDTWSALPSLPAPRSAGGLAYVNSTLHFFAGFQDRRNDSNTHWLLDLRNLSAGWQVEDEVPEEASKGHFQAVAIGQLVYLVGGQHHHDIDPNDIPNLTAYDTVTKQWTSKADLLSPRSHAESNTLAVNDRIIIMGGRNNHLQGIQYLHNTVDQYNPQLDSWKRLGFIPGRLIGCQSGFFKNISFRGVEGDYIVLTTGGTDWNKHQNQTCRQAIIHDANEVRGFHCYS